ncbi:MAG: T9SS type A sorting domain-containing protein [Bacteroidota bacterium]
MIRLFTLLFISIAFFGLSSAQAQISCDYTLRLLDRFGDSWNGAALQVTINDSEPLVFFLTEEDGEEAEFPFIVTTGDSIQLEFFSGSFDSEVAYFLLDAEGNELFMDGPNPSTGIVYTDEAVCPSCPAPPISEIDVFNTRAEFVDVTWLAPDPGGSYILQYGAVGFNPDSAGQVVTVANDTARLGGLLEKTMYDLYITGICTNGDTSQIAGPVQFETVFKNDVGIVAIPSPISDCGLMSVETVEVTLQNFGANPQTLIPFDFSINGVPAGVSMPFDGVFTGVLGKDSTFTTEFDLRAPVGDPDRYVIQAWTALEEDSDMTNDTFEIVVLSIPLVEEYPYFTDLEEGFDGWRVDEENSVNSSWAVGTPDFGNLTSAVSGDNAWLTGLDTTYNNNELSYLVSPCYNFTSLTEDPLIRFSYYVETEACCDAAWVELSLDGGENWEKVLASEDARNWYNDVANQRWRGNGREQGSLDPAWAPASSTLIGAAGNEDVRVRFVFSSDFSTARNGFGVDNLFISTPLENDLAGIEVRNTSEEDCGEVRDEIEFIFSNFGTTPQSGIDISYQVNDGEIITQPLNDNIEIDPGQTVGITFDVPFNSAEANSYTILAWVTVTNDEFVLNDTARFVFSPINDIPFVEDFERGTLPEGWEVVDEIAPVTTGHGAPSNVLSDNLWRVDTRFEAFSPVFGPIEAGDSLTFDYRYVNFGGTGSFEKELSDGDSLVVYLSTDCGINYDLKVLQIDSSNHMISNNLAQQVIYLDDYDLVGENIKVFFAAYWGSGDYFLDIDNVGILRCPPDLGLSVNVVDETRSNAADGSISIDPSDGESPYTYKWSNGATTKGIFNLEGGVYEVTVSDAFGCSEVISVTVNTTVSTQAIRDLTKAQLAPNPTNGQATFFLEFASIKTVDIAIFNAFGQRVQQLPQQMGRSLQPIIDLSNQTSGWYFVQLQVDGQVHTERLLFVKE